MEARLRRWMEVRRGERSGIAQGDIRLMEQSDEVRYPLLAQQIVQIMVFMSEIDSVLHHGLTLFTVSGEWE
jgi:hypothetical protein